MEEVHDVCLAHIGGVSSDVAGINLGIVGVLVLLGDVVSIGTTSTVETIYGDSIYTIRQVLDILIGIEGHLVALGTLVGRTTCTKA